MPNEDDHRLFLCIERRKPDLLAFSVKNLEFSGLLDRFNGWNVVGSNHLLVDVMFSSPGEGK